MAAATAALLVLAGAAAGRAPRVAIGPATAVGGAGAVAKPHQAHAGSQAPAPAPEVAPDPAPEAAKGGSEPAPLFADHFEAPDGLLTNEYAHWNPGHADAVTSPAWEVTSGSLFVRDGEAWTGVPDGGCGASTATSTPCNDSAVFRANTVRSDFGDVAVSFELRNERLVSTARTPALAWDGVHIWLRHRSEYSLYAASVNRRDGSVVIKKKCPGGSENEGTYYELGAGGESGHPLPFGAVQQLRATVRNEAGAVAIAVERDGEPLVSARDTGLGCAPITAPGAVGLRGDNDQFSFDDFVVRGL